MAVLATARVACFRQALGTDKIMFTSHADMQRNRLTGWHKDDGTKENNPAEKGYFSEFAYDSDECKVYKAGVYLEDHDRDEAGLWVREGSHRMQSYKDGEVRYTGARAGSIVIFDVRVTHAGESSNRVLTRLFNTPSLAPATAKARRMYLSLIGRCGRAFSSRLASRTISRSSSPSPTCNGSCNSRRARARDCQLRCAVRWSRMAC